MVMRIPVGRMYEWAKDAYRARTPNEFSRAHPFPNEAGDGFDAGTDPAWSGDKECVRCGRHRNVHVAPRELGIDALVFLSYEGAMIQNTFPPSEARHERLLAWLGEYVTQLRLYRKHNPTPDEITPEPDGSLSPQSVVTALDSHLTRLEEGVGIANAHEVIVRLLETMPNEGVSEWVAEIGMLPTDSAVPIAKTIRLLQRQAIPAARDAGLPI
jgi:hypothetical protein